MKRNEMDGWMDGWTGLHGLAVLPFTRLSLVVLLHTYMHALLILASAGDFTVISLLLDS